LISLRTAGKRFKNRKKMNTQQIKEQLCIYDKRNPNYEEYDKPIKSENCFCDNCFRGRNDLADELLRVKDLLNSAVDPIR